MTDASQAPDPGDATVPGRLRRRVLAGAAIVLVAAVVMVAVLASRHGHHRASGLHSTAAGATTVRRRNLVTSQDATGKISYAGSSTVEDQLSGTLTWVAAVGSVIQPGERLFDVDNYPVILLNGVTPAYRELDDTDTPGPDVAQLNSNLINLGYDPDPIVDDDEWQAATTAGVEAMQEADGVPQTGSLNLGDIEFLGGAQRVATRADSSGGAGPASDADPAGGHAVFLSDVVSKSRGATTSSASSAAVSRLQKQLGRLQQQNRALAHRISQAQARAAAGPATGGDTPVLDTTSTNLVVAATVPAGGQSVTRVGARVPVVLPSGVVVKGRVVHIGQVNSSGSSPEVPITIHLLRHENGRDLDQASVSVQFVAKVARRVLSVPVTALIAQPGGRYAVQLAQPPHSLIRVELGTFATGFVEVSGSGLRPGLQVTDSQG